LSNYIRCLLSNCVQLVMIEMSGRNEPRKNISSTLGDDDRVQAAMGGPLIVTSHGTPRAPIEGTSDAW
jgi:hypothetical protein